MKGSRGFSGKRTAVLGAIIGLLAGFFLGYWTYTQVISTFVGKRQVVLISHGGFFQITEVKMGYTADGNIERVDVVVRNTDGDHAHDGILTAGEVEKTPNSINISLLFGEEKTISLDITPPAEQGEETIIFVGVEDTV
jgi:hypothetical protein